MIEQVKLVLGGWGSFCMPLQYLEYSCMPLGQDKICTHKLGTGFWCKQHVGDKWCKQHDKGWPNGQIRHWDNGHHAKVTNGQRVDKTSRCIVSPQLWTDILLLTGSLTLRWWHHSIYWLHSPLWPITSHSHPSHYFCPNHFASIQICFHPSQPPVETNTLSWISKKFGYHLCISVTCWGRTMINPMREAFQVY